MKHLLKKLNKEHKKLNKKIIKLSNFIENNDEFEKISTDMQNLLEIQVLAMATYANTLHARINFIEEL